MIQQKSNDLTIGSYNNHAFEYIRNTPDTYNYTHQPMLGWINYSLSRTGKRGNIFEIGTGPGRDARYIEQSGYNILRSDAAQAFVDILRGQGHEAIKFNVLTDEFPDLYDLIFANAVMPHFTPEELDFAIQKILHALKPNGFFSFSVKQGRGEQWIGQKLPSKRFVHYWQPHSLMRFMAAYDLKPEFFLQDIPGDLPSHTWILAVYKKQSNLPSQSL